MLAAWAQTDSAKPQFKKPQVGMNESVQITGAEGPAIGRPAAVDRNVVDDVETLEEKRETVDTELRYAKSKLEVAQKKLSVQSAAGNADQVEKLNTEIKDWEARIKASQDQLAAIDAEISKAQPPTLVGDSELVLPGENVELFVNEDQSFNGRYQVRRGGYIILPQVGRIAVAGKSLDQAEAAVRRALQSSQLTKATVLLERIAGSDVESGPLIYLSGEFKNPRPYRIAAGTAPTLVGVILSCGGLTDRADLTHVKVMRMAGGRGVVEDVNVQKMLDGAGLTSDITLGEGDVITVPSGPASLIYVTGNVKRQGSFTLVSGERLTAYGAILQAGGFARFANLKDVHVLRAMPDGTKRKLPINIVDVQKGRKQDVVLQANDIVVIPEKWFSF